MSGAANEEEVEATIPSGFSLPVSKEVLENAPGFDKDHWPDTSEHAWLMDIYSYYGSDPYWR